MNDETLDELRPRLVAAMIPHVAFDGWGAASVAAGAADAGIDPDVAGLIFPKGAIEMAVAYTTLANDRLAAALQGLEGRFLLSLNDVPEVRTQFAWADIAEVQTKYSVAGGGRTVAAAELLIGNTSANPCRAPRTAAWNRFIVLLLCEK